MLSPDSVPDLETLGMEIDRRQIAELPPFELVETFITAVNYHQPNFDTLGLSEHPVENGRLVCVESFNYASGYTASGLRVSNSGLIGRTAAFNQAYASFVGLWPRGRDGQGEAAPYEVRAPFKLRQPQSAQKFRPLATAILDTQPGLQQLAATEEATFYYRPQDQLPAQPGSPQLSPLMNEAQIPLLLQPDTALVVEIEKASSASSTHGKETYTLHISGPATLQLPPAWLIKVTEQGKVQSSGDKAMTLHAVLPAEAPLQVVSRFLIGTEVFQNGDGQLMFQSPREESPRVIPTGLSHRQAIELLDADLPWVDTTKTFLQQHRTTLLDACPIDRPRKLNASWPRGEKP